MGLSPSEYRLMLPMVELTIFALGILLIDLIVPPQWKWINAPGPSWAFYLGRVCRGLMAL
jgi:hypothetical protein